MEELLKKAEDLAGRPLEVIKVPSGYIVEWFNFNTSPPPVKPTKEAALEAFIQFLELHKKETPDAVDNNDTGEPLTQDEGPFGPR